MAIEMYDVCIFAGTTEGREVADLYRDRRERVCVFTATEYGGSLISEGNNVHVTAGRLDMEEITELLQKKTVQDAMVIDATHPYAAIITENIRAACEKSDRRYIRVLRDTGVSARIDSGVSIAEQSETPLSDESSIVYVPSTSAAAEYLKTTEGNVLLTTGSKELSLFTVVPDYENRLYARVLSLPSVVTACDALGFRGKNLICMQGPFTEEFNVALLHQIQAKWLVTKETGKTGGFPEKLSAAAKAGCKVIIIGKPVQESGYSVAEFSKTFLR